MSWFKTQSGTHHLHKTGSTYATVHDNGRSVKLMRWHEHTGLTPDESNHPSVALAKAEAEKWLKKA